MKKKLISFLAIIVMITMSGCGEVAIPKYNAPKAKIASSAITGTPIHVKYSVGREINTDSYYLYSGNSNRPFATSDFNARNRIPLLHKYINIPEFQRIRIYGTIGDKIVFVFSNGLSGGEILGVYDHSERKTYFLTDGKSNKKYMFLKKGTSYVVKLIEDNKYISLNNLREVQINPSEYKLLTLRFTWDNIAGGVNTYPPQSIMNDKMGGHYMSTIQDTKRHPMFLFGSQPQKTPAQ